MSTNVDQAKIAEDSGACYSYGLERIPSDIRKDGGIARMSDPEMIWNSNAIYTCYGKMQNWSFC